MLEVHPPCALAFQVLAQSYVASAQTMLSGLVAKTGFNLLIPVNARQIVSHRMEPLSHAAASRSAPVGFL